MVIFIRRIHQHGAEPSIRQLFCYLGVDVGTYFPHHQRVVAEYHPLPQLLGTYTGTMSVYPSEERVAPDIRSRFIAWHCFRCQEMHHSFTGHEFEPSIDGAPHCVGELSEQHEHNPNTDETPYLVTRTLHTNEGNRDRGMASLQKRFFIRRCYECRTQYVHPMDDYLCSARGLLARGHVCHGEPLNAGVLMADCHRAQLQEKVHGGDHDHEEDNHGGNQDRVSESQRKQPQRKSRSSRAG